MELDAGDQDTGARHRDDVRDVLLGTAPVRQSLAGLCAGICVCMCAGMYVYRMCALSPL